MSVLPSMPPAAEQEAEKLEVPEPVPDSVDPISRSTSPRTPMPDEAFVEELLRDAYLPRDGKP